MMRFTRLRSKVRTLNWINAISTGLPIRGAADDIGRLHNLAEGAEVRERIGGGCGGQRDAEAELPATRQEGEGRRSISLLKESEEPIRRRPCEQSVPAGLYEI